MLSNFWVYTFSRIICTKSYARVTNLSGLNKNNAANKYIDLTLVCTIYAVTKTTPYEPDANEKTAATIVQTTMIYNKPTLT